MRGLRPIMQQGRLRQRCATRRRLRTLVERGAVPGYSGITGRSNGPHLHDEIMLKAATRATLASVAGSAGQ